MLTVTLERVEAERNELKKKYIAVGDKVCTFTCSFMFSNVHVHNRSLALLAIARWSRC